MKAKFLESKLFTAIFKKFLKRFFTRNPKFAGYVEKLSWLAGIFVIVQDNIGSLNIVNQNISNWLYAVLSVLILALRFLDEPEKEKKKREFKKRKNVVTDN